MARSGSELLGVWNWVSGNVAKPEVVEKVELNGNASANPRY